MTRLYRKRPRRVTCQRCFKTGLDVDGVILHFSLTKVTFVPVPDRRDTFRMTMRGAGSIDLCEPCWRTSTGASRIRRSPVRA